MESVIPTGASRSEAKWSRAIAYEDSPPPSRGRWRGNPRRRGCAPLELPASCREQRPRRAPPPSPYDGATSPETGEGRLICESPARDEGGNAPYAVEGSST